MTQFYDTIDELPTHIPLFPLSGVLLLPRGQLPLNIFEPRYIELVETCLGQGRVIGMIQPRDEPEDEQSADKMGRDGLQKIGCLGRITSFSETEEGRFLVALTGISRFEISQELNVLTPYRQAHVAYHGFAQDLTPNIGELDVKRDELLHVLDRYLTKNQLSIDWDNIAQSSNEELVNSLSMISPYGLREKQAMLEAETLSERCDILIALTEMVLAQAEQQDNDNIVQ